MDDQPSPILAYATPGPRRKPSGCLAFFVGATIGVFVSMVGWWMLTSGGPIFPLTVVYAPLACIWESLYSKTSITLAIWFGGPLLLGTYAVVIARGRWWLITAVAIVHVGSFWLVCKLRAVIW